MSSRPLKTLLPWWGRIPAKVGLALLPVSPRHLKKLGLFNHGEMESLEYAEHVFGLHLEAHRRATGTMPREGFSALELGPGDSLVSALLAWTAGAARTYLVDAGDFAQRDAALYRAMAAQLNNRNARKIAFAESDGADQIISACGGEYQVDGLQSLRKLPSGSV